MNLQKPYKRIVHPFLNQGYYFEWGDPNYIEDVNYASDIIETIRAYNIIEKDLIALFDYIEPQG